LGLVVGLDYKDPGMDIHYQFQRYKSHPYIAELIKDGKVVSYGAKALSAGGWFARPRPYFDGGLFVGESAGLLDAQRLKGIHLAIKSG
ncbi:MAG: electron transfer flavoprotein-ubiquinone oxidoreductase, partial [Planctomycetes bacterium]|nr:electron transfer flavoprotein-ubiquinone oxidoreductase [Planctomycetota bacterium]